MIQGPSKYRTLLFRLILIAVMAAVLTRPMVKSYLIGYTKAFYTDYARKVGVEEGDLVFQNMAGHLTEIISYMTNSPYSHCGIVIKKANTFYVLESMWKVKETPFDLWVAQGMDQKFTVVRLKGELANSIQDIIHEAYKFLDHPYDLQYKWDDKRIYCSELIYKAVYDATGVSLANFVTLGDLRWQKYEDLLRFISRGNLPLARQVITPASLVESNRVEIIYSDWEN